MNIAANTPSFKSYTLNAEPAAAKEKSSSDTLVDQIVDKTFLSANYAASGLSGAAVGTAAWAGTGIAQTLKTTGSAVANIIKTEKYGPVLKAVAVTGAVVAGLAGGVLAAPVALIAGAIKGSGTVDSSTPRQFTIDAANKKAYNGVKDGINETAQDIQKSMKELGDHKLQPGEKRIEIPLIRAAKTIVMGAVAAVVGGAVGIATAAASAITETGKGIADAFTDDRLNIAEKVFSSASSVVGGVAHGLSYGVRSGLATLGQAVGTTWDKDSAIEGGKKLFSEAGTSIAASIAPRRTLLEEVPAQA